MIKALLNAHAIANFPCQILISSFDGFFHQDFLVIYPGIEAAVNAFVWEASEHEFHHLVIFTEELSKITSEMNATRGK